MEKSSEMNQNQINDSNHFDPGMDLVTTKSSSCSRNKMLETSSGEDVVTTCGPSRKAGSETAVPALTLLPPEMWLKIFQHCVSTDGALPVLLRVAGVCRTWRNLVREPILWEKLDMRCGMRKPIREFMEWLVSNRLSRCKEMIMQDWSYMTNTIVEVFARRCPRLQTVDLSECKRLSDKGVVAFFRSCPKLKNMNLPCPLGYGKFLSRVSQRSSLECLSISFPDTEWRYLDTNFGEIVCNCLQLKEVRMSNKFSRLEEVCIDPGELQIHCPLLRVLELKNISVRGPLFFREEQAQTNGLVHMQELRCGGTRENWNDVDSLLYRLLFNSEQLKVLDMSGYCNFDASVLLSLPMKALEELNLSRTAVTGPVLQEIFQKWRHSLTTVTLNGLHLDPSELEAALQILTDLPSCPVRELSLSCTRASLSSVRMLTGKLEHLEVLRLEESVVPAECSCKHR